MNKADAEIMLGLLREAGYDVAESEDDADILIINTCGVKEPTEKKVLRKISEVNLSGKPFIVGGCLPRINLSEVLRAGPRFAAVVDTNSLFSIVDVVRQVERGRRGILKLGEEKSVKLGIPRKPFNPVVAIIPISEGCLGDCHYCCVKFARGRLFSYPPDTILDEIEKSVRRGCREIWLTSQDTGAYYWKGEKLPDLLQRIVELPLEFRVRVGMANPKHTIKILDDLVEAYRHPKIYKFLHVPVQSGSNEILEAMNRGYTREQFIEIVEAFRAEIPGTAIATDIIVGFPGETSENFQESVSLIKEVRPDVVNISRFAPRPGTRAAEMSNQIPGGTIKERSRELTKIALKIGEERNRAWIGWRGTALVTERGLKGGWIARNPSYKPIVINHNEQKLGGEVQVEVTAATPIYLVGRIIKPSETTLKTLHNIGVFTLERAKDS